MTSSSLNWQPSASIETLKTRATFIQHIRQFFIDRGYLEVETPSMAQHGVTDVYLSNIKATFQNRTYYLQTSPEYHMKRLLSAGSGPIFQLAKVFRDDELGRWHNPEFTLLEWYQLNINHHDLMTEMGCFLELFLKCPPLERKTYQNIFLEYCDIDPFDTTLSALKSCLTSFKLDNILPLDETDKDQYFFLLLSHVIEPALKTLSMPIALYDFPPSQASLAQIHHGVAQRFEVYFQGVELANGFHELSDVALQKKRFLKDQHKRQSMGLGYLPIDPLFLNALEAGLPPCSGVALGIDRLFALALGFNTIQQAIAFDVSRA